MDVRTFPSIDHGHKAKLDSSSCHGARVIIQEKVDGSQLSICNIDGKLRFFNKRKEISARSKPFLNSHLSLADKPQLFKAGHMYHGEAMNSRQPNTIQYGREPRYFWIIYEVVKGDTSLYPEQVEELIQDTGLEYIRPLYDNLGNTESTDYVEIANGYIEQITKGGITSILGGVPEGVVLKTINRMKNGKRVNTRYKFVRTEFAEMNRSRKRRLPKLSDAAVIDGIGSVYNVPARFQKGVQHIQEEGKWDYDATNRNLTRLVNELDADLLKEYKDDIKNMLFIRFFPQICKAARADLTEFVDTIHRSE
jgi:RNA ligase-like protein